MELINGGNELTFEKADHYKKNRFIIQAGVNRSTFKFTGTTDLVGLQFTKSYSPAFSVGFDHFIKPAVGKVILRTEISFHTDKFHGEYKKINTWQDYYDLKRNTIGVNLSILTNLYNGSSFKFFIGAGGGLNFSNYPENNHYTIYGEPTPAATKFAPHFNASSITLAGRAGCVLRNRIEFSFMCNGVIGRLTENYTAYSDKYSSQQLRVGYLFSNRKK
ncbi:hypothetical protein QJ048_02015 [Pinibacter sp. MAH-24]|uniref:Outer membrane protein beta-barrel domain-containing protein n=1 Tax=Pinibacter soli TaxID=3044211 RepID=A0ABT6R7S9_9BACT|nr:hypothetical protein [Pinibacter soli]